MGEAKRKAEALPPLAEQPTRLRVTLERVQLVGVKSEPCERCNRVYRTTDQAVAQALAEGGRGGITCPCGQEHVLERSLVVSGSEALRERVVLQTARRR